MAIYGANPRLSKEELSKLFASEESRVMYSKNRFCMYTKDNKSCNDSNPRTYTEIEKAIANTLVSNFCEEYEYYLEDPMLFNSDQFYNDTLLDNKINVLYYIIDHGYVNDEVYSGVIHILSMRDDYVDSEILTKYIDLCDTAVSNIESPITRRFFVFVEFILDCAIKWNTKEMIPILKKMNVKYEPSKSRIDMVIEDLENGINPNDDDDLFL